MVEPENSDPETTVLVVVVFMVRKVVADHVSVIVIFHSSKDGNKIKAEPFDDRTLCGTKRAAEGEPLIVPIATKIQIIKKEMVAVPEGMGN